MRKRRSIFFTKFIKLYIRAAELLYHQFAWAYDLVAWVVSFGHWSRWRMDALDYLKAGSILETGFGTGDLLIALTERGYNVTGLELSPAMQRVTSRKLKRKGAAVRRVLARTEAIPFEKNAFRNILSTFPSEYIIKEETLQEVKRVLNREGRWVILGLSVEFKRGLKHWLTRWFLHDISGSMIRYFTEKAEGAGFHAEVIQHQAADYSQSVLILEKAYD